MVAAFPVAKLAAIFIKQVSKPLANAVKTRAKTSPFFRNYVCMPPAQFYHWAEVRIKMWSMNLGKPVNIPKLNEAMAIELGAELVGETVIFSIATAVLIAEYVRSSRKEAAKEEERRLEMLQIQADLKELYFTKARLETQVRELVRILHVNLPQSSYNPDDPTLNDIPLHHREDKVKEESGGIISGITGLIWGGIDLLLPSVDDTSDEKVPNSSKPQPSTTVTTSESNEKNESNTRASSSNVNVNKVVETPSPNIIDNKNNNSTNATKR